MNKIKDRNYYEKEASFEVWEEWYKKEEKDDYIHPDVATDAVIVHFNKNTKTLQVLLQKRTIHPYQGKWTLPGTFLHSHEENIEASLRRMFADKLKTTIPTNAVIDQLGTFSNVNRDPRGQVVSVVHMIYTPKYIEPVDENMEWFSFLEIENDTFMDFGFDHKEVLNVANSRIKGQWGWTPMAINSLKSPFTLGNLAHLQAEILGISPKKVNRPNLRKKMLKFITQEDMKDNVAYYRLK